MMDLPSSTFFSLARRVFAYPGVLQAKLREQNREPATRASSAPTPSGPAGQRWNLRERGGEAVAVHSDAPSYLHEKMKEARP